MKDENASTPICETITQSVAFLCELSKRKDISIFSILCTQGALSVSFLLHSPNTNETLKGERTFNKNTKFKDPDDLLDELWMTENLLDLSVS